MTIRLIHCCGCNKKVDARLTNGEEIYPHRSDLFSLNFWKCDTCGNSVGCHNKVKSNPTQPLGVIPTPELKAKRQQIHRELDPLWQQGHFKRGHLYARLTEALGFKYHTASLRTIEECNKALHEIAKINGELSIS